MNDLTITFLRHGRSRADDEQVCEGRYDSPLTETGREQARKLAAYWAANPPGFDRAYCSTLCRASETAAIVTETLGLSVIPSDLLREFDNGPLAGLPFAEANARYPIPAFRHELQAFTADGGESQAEFRARALQALALVWAGGGNNVLVVAHGGIINAMLRELTGAHRAHFAFGDTSYASLRLGREHQGVTLLGVNLAPHLPT